MVNRAKQQGTAEETWLRKAANKHRTLTADRYAEGGSLDLGDVWIHGPSLDFGVESKAAESISPINRLQHQSEKVAAGYHPALHWHRRIKTKPDAKRRTSLGRLTFVWWHTAMLLVKSSPVPVWHAENLDINQFSYHQEMKSLPAPDGSSPLLHWRTKDGMDLGVLWTLDFLHILASSAPRKP